MQMVVTYREPTPAEEARRIVRWGYGAKYIRYWNPRHEPKPGDMVPVYRPMLGPERATFESRYDAECRRLGI